VVRGHELPWGMSYVCGHAGVGAGQYNQIASEIGTVVSFQEGVL